MADREARMPTAAPRRQNTKRAPAPPKMKIPAKCLGRTLRLRFMLYAATPATILAATSGPSAKPGSGVRGQTCAMLVRPTSPCEGVRSTMT
jgi:hypothetical protein